jgi:starch phosphorylase
MAWDQAWDITRNTCHFTNHTLLPEALETWSVDCSSACCPGTWRSSTRSTVASSTRCGCRFFGDEARVARMSLIDEDGGRRVRMAHLAAVGSKAINGVAALHTELLKTTVMRDFYEMWPEKFHNVTNGVTPRRFIVVSNPEARPAHHRGLRRRPLGCGICLSQATGAHAEDHGLPGQMAQGQDRREAGRWPTGSASAPASRRTRDLFDVQAKRIHEYKRQHLNLLHIVWLYEQIKQNPNIEMTPRTFIFGGKAAPGYFMAKLIIKLVNAVGEVINNDPQVNGHLRVAFMPTSTSRTASGCTRRRIYRSRSLWPAKRRPGPAT